MDAQESPLQNTNPISSLVCGSCWSRLFSSGSFHTAWNAASLSNGFSYTITWDEIVASAGSGCGWCLILRENRDGPTHESQIKVTVGFSRRNSSSCTPKDLESLRLIINGIPKCVFYLYTEAGERTIYFDKITPVSISQVLISEDNPASHYIHARCLMLDVSSPNSYQLASNCLEECISSHDSCPKPQINTLPTRVVDCLDPKKPKLLISGGIRKPYAALSYVWGEKQPHSTSSENLETYSTHGINPCLLPKTICDAIDSTRQFGLRYLWVDSLCILQDSREDKDREIAQMRHIFQNAHLTIIAASARRVGEGFLHRRPSPLPDVRLPFRCPDDGKIGSMVLSPVWRQYDETQEPVSSRAWCLEERLLSPRALIYASHTLQYHCQSHTVNIGNSICAPRSGRRLPRLTLLPDPPCQLTAEESSSLRTAWYDILEDYTSRDVTKSRDKLLAIAGVAEKFRSVLGSEYVGGLWRHTLLHDLLWMKDYNSYASRPAKYRAPSWSWAAVDGHVFCRQLDSRLDPNRYEIMKCDVLQCEVSLLNKKFIFGRVDGGTLKIRGPLKRVMWDPWSSLPKLFDYPVQEKESEQHLQMVINQGAIEQQPLCDAYPDSLDEVSSSTTEAWALPILWNITEKYTVGLVIVAVPERSNHFRRVGYYCSLNDLRDITWLEKSPVVCVTII